MYAFDIDENHKKTEEMFIKNYGNVFIETLIKKLTTASRLVGRLVDWLIGPFVGRVSWQYHCSYCNQQCKHERFISIFFNSTIEKKNSLFLELFSSSKHSISSIHHFWCS